MAEYSVARIVRFDWLSHSKERRECFESIFRKEDEEKTMREATDVTATSAVLLIEAATSLTDSPITTAASSCMGQFVDYQVGMEISEANLKRSEFKEVPESRKVRWISRSSVSFMDIVGTAQVDYGNTQLSETEFERKAVRREVHARGRIDEEFRGSHFGDTHHWNEVWSCVGFLEGPGGGTR